MNYLTIENVSKHYGEKVLLNRVNIFVDQGQKIALVAKNGSGKSTLLRIVAGEEGAEGEDAVIRIHKDVRLGFLKQENIFEAGQNILDVVFSTDTPMMNALREYELALLNPENEKRMEKAIAEMESLKAWDFEVEVKQILAKLGISTLKQDVGLLSGGQRKRLALARELLKEPDFLILDEPTNHLDLHMIEWLEEYLKQGKITLFMVTHDRYFLDNVCNTILELEEGTIHKYKGNYSYYLEKKAMREEVDQRTMSKNKSLFKRELEWMRKSPQARGTKAKSRQDGFHKLKEETSKSVNKDIVNIEMHAARLGKKIVNLHNVSKAYDGRVLIDKFEYKFSRNERVGIVGVNGSGKSTFLKMLTGQIKPDSGKVVIGDTIEFGYYKQEGLKLKVDKRVIDVIRDIAEFIPLTKGRKLTAESLLERFLFNRKQQQVYASQLSGGEKRRLYLLTILMGNPNFLILDEPTNDLDILTLNVLEDFLIDYQGCLLVVTHDRYFMDKLVDHLFIFDGKGEIRYFIGNYSDYREDLKAQEEKARKEKQAVKKIEKDKPKLTYDERKKIGKLEKTIERLETKKVELGAKMNDTNLSTEDLIKLSNEYQSLLEELEMKEMEWMELAEKG